MNIILAPYSTIQATFQL